MILFKRAADLVRWLDECRRKGQTIGFVPTMGALHTGHISLIDISKKSSQVTVCSIFINPTQFNDPKDFQKYPVTLEKDIEMLETAGTDVLFLPDVSDIYPGGTKELESYDLGRLETLLEGKYRPGHFQGVCQVMRRLLDFVRPDDLFMGQKDYQQCMVVGRLIAIMDYPTRLHPCPIIRETDGLAKSSRNLRLTETERAVAPAIFKAISAIKNKWLAGKTHALAAPAGTNAGDRPAANPSPAALEQEALTLLTDQGFRPDYVSIADAVTLAPLTQHNGSGQRSVVLVAAFLGEIRLIDNMLMDE